MPFIQANNIRIFYRVFQNSVESATINPQLQTMIVLHGAPGLVDHQIEVDAWKSLSTQVQVIFPDLRGCGKTDDGNLSQWSLELCADDLYAFSEALSLKHPIIAGISFGGFIVMRYLEKYASHPKAIIFCISEARKSPEERRKTFLRVGTPAAAEAAAIFDADPTNLEKSNRFFETCVPYFSKKPFSLIPPAKSNPSLWLKASKIWSEMDLRNYLNQITCPTLVLAGEDDPNHPIASTTETAYCIPQQFRYFIPIKGAGAPVYQDQPEIFNTQVISFLKHVLDRRTLA